MQFCHWLAHLWLFLGLQPGESKKRGQKQQKPALQISSESSENGSLLQTMQAAHKSLIDTLVSEYGEHYEVPFFREAFYEVADSGQALRSRFLQSVLQQGNFTFAFTGISNTAGHDNLVSRHILS